MMTSRSLATQEGPTLSLTPMRKSLAKRCRVTTMSSQQKPYPSLHLKSCLPRNAEAALQIEKSPQKLPAEVYVEVEAEAGLQEHTRSRDHAVTTSFHLIRLFSIYFACARAQHCRGSYTLYQFCFSIGCIILLMCVSRNGVRNLETCLDVL